MYKRETYYKRYPAEKRYAIGYKCITLEGKVKITSSVKEMSKYTGYSVSYLKQVFSGNKQIKGMKLERIYN